MPFIISPHSPAPKTDFYVLRSIDSRVQTSPVVQKLALTFHNQNKKVLIFDALLGLKNYPLHNAAQDKIPNVLDGRLPLSDIIVAQQNADIIAGISSKNLNALSQLNQQKIKRDLMQLAPNYDVVIIDCPSMAIHSLFQQIGQIYWITSPNQNLLLKTLRVAAQEEAPKIILDQVKNADQRNNLHLFIKNLLPKCQIIELFDQKNIEKS